MDERVAQLAQELLEGGISRLSEREQKVITHIAKRLHSSRDLGVSLEASQTFGDRLADKVARFGGSWIFILAFSGLLIVWIVLNTLVLSIHIKLFDPYPFIFLNLILSMVAALQAPVILMSQNRQAARDRMAAALDYEINLKSEIEIMALHEKLDRIRVEHLEGVLREQSGQLKTLLQHCNGKRDVETEHPAPAVTV